MNETFRLNICPYVTECVSRQKDNPNCIPNYKECMAYIFYEEKRLHGRIIPEKLEKYG